MRINHNISALKANNQLAKTNNALDASLERLSSGYRINSAADDSAGLAISEKMRTQIAGLDQASRNASDGISVIQTAEGALSEVESMLQRMRELSVQSANGTLTTSDRTAIQSEIDQMNDEISRISDTTEFNTMSLLNGNIDRKSYSSNNKIDLISLSDTVSIGDYKLKVTQDARQAVFIGDDTTFANISDAIKSDEAGTININGEDVTVTAGETIEDVFTKIRDTANTVGVNAFATTGAIDPSASADEKLAKYKLTNLANGTHLGFVSNEYGADQKVEIYCDNAKLASLFGLSPAKVTTKGFDAEASLETNTSASQFTNTATLSISGNKIAISDSNGFQMVVEAAAGTAGTTFIDASYIAASNVLTAAKVDVAGAGDSATISVLDAGPMDLQIGANEDQTMAVRIPEVNPETLGINKVNIATADGAQKAITLIDSAINTVSAIRSKLGAYENRLDHSISNLDTASENMTESLSRISDVDMAEEMANYTQKNVLAQAGTSMLAQANQRPQAVLSLLQQG